MESVVEELSSNVTSFPNISSFLATHKYPDGLNSNQKRTLRKAAVNFTLTGDKPFKKQVKKNQFIHLTNNNQIANCITLAKVVDSNDLWWRRRTSGVGFSPIATATTMAARRKRWKRSRVSSFGEEWSKMWSIGCQIHFN